MVALELISGQRQWELNIAGISTPWVAGDWVFVVTDDAQADLPSARNNGKIRWITQLAGIPQREEEARADLLSRAGSRGRPPDPRQLGRHADQRRSDQRSGSKARPASGRR